MDLSNDLMIKPFLRNFLKYKRNHPLARTKAILNQIYLDLQESDDSMPRLPQPQLLSHQQLPKHFTDEAIIKEIIKDDTYFPQHIKEYILKNKDKQVQTLYKNPYDEQKEINIYVTTFAENGYGANADQIKKAFMWLAIARKYARKICAETMNIYIYMTPFLKKVPKDPKTTLGVDQVNTAFTRACDTQGEIIIYRQEEWFKVLIHESFHAYGLDFSDQQTDSLKNDLKNLFKIDSKFQASEAYAEFWARILNCCFCGFTAAQMQKKAAQKASFMLYVEFCLQLERMFSIYQAHKVLNYMGLTYQDLINGNGNTKKYREETHVFAYYILTAIFFNDYPAFLQWCKLNNQANLYQFPSEGAAAAPLITFISEHYKTLSEEQDRHLQHQACLQDTTRMTLLG